MNDSERGLSTFFNPASIAIIGASKDVTSIGGKPLRNLIKHHYKGKLYPVNPKYSEIHGLPCYSSLRAIPGDVDLVLIAVSQKYIFDVVQQCKEKKVKFITVFGAGFAEMGKEGAAIQQKLTHMLKGAGIRLCGPNCIGSINVKNSIPMGFSNTFERKSFLSGNVGMVSQSGALGYATFALAQEAEIGFSYVANPGNQSDLTTLDFLDYLVEDNQTSVIAAYMEGIPNGQQLKQSVQKATRLKKPVVILKSGRSDIGRQAALSHTGSLAGSDESFKAMATQYGVTLVQDSDDMIDTLKVFSRNKPAGGKNIAVISTSGASGIMLADSCEEMGLSMTVLSEETRMKMKAILPDFASSVNPVDITAQALNKKDIFRKCLRVMIDAPEVDALVVTTTFAGELVETMMKEVINVDKGTQKPIVVALIGPEDLVGMARKRLEKARIPTYDSITRTTAALKRLIDYSRFVRDSANLKREEGPAFGPLENDPLEANMHESAVKSLLRAWDIPVPKGKTVISERGIRNAAHQLNYPLVAKVISEEVPHKTDVGGVILEITNEDKAVEAVQTILKRIQANLPHVRMEGVLLEEMVKGPVLETIVGIKKDPQFGLMIMCGLGGIHVELVKDVALRCLPITKLDAIAMIKELKTYPLFTGYRGGLVYDVDEFATTLVKLAHLALQHETDLLEMEINPLVVRPQGQGVMALDGLIRVNKAETVMN